MDLYIWVYGFVYMGCMDAKPIRYTFLAEHYNNNKSDGILSLSITPVERVSKKQQVV